MNRAERHFDPGLIDPRGGTWVVHECPTPDEGGQPAVSNERREGYVPGGTTAHERALRLHEATHVTDSPLAGPDKIAEIYGTDSAWVVGTEEARVNYRARSRSEDHRAAMEHLYPNAPRAADWGRKFEMDPKDAMTLALAVLGQTERDDAEIRAGTPPDAWDALQEVAAAIQAAAHLPTATARREAAYPLAFRALDRWDQQRRQHGGGIGSGPQPQGPGRPGAGQGNAQAPQPQPQTPSQTRQQTDELRKAEKQAERTARALARKIREQARQERAALGATVAEQPAGLIGTVRPNIGRKPRHGGTARGWLPMRVHRVGSPTRRRTLRQPKAPAERAARAGAEICDPVALRFGEPGWIAQGAERERGGTLLIDGSGSVQVPVEQVVRFLEAAPDATVAIYATATTPQWEPRGAASHVANLGILATKGRIADPDEIRAWIARNVGGYNGADGTALRWLTNQTPPFVWYTDGCVNGGSQTDGAEDERLKGECNAHVEQHDVEVIDADAVTLDKYLERRIEQARARGRRPRR